MPASEKALDERLRKIIDFIEDQEELDLFGFIVIGVPKKKHRPIRQLSNIPIPSRIQVLEDLYKEKRARFLGKYTIIEG